MLTQRIMEKGIEFLFNHPFFLSENATCVSALFLKLKTEHIRNIMEIEWKYLHFT